MKQFDREWLELKDIEDMKEFALKNQSTIWPAVLFALKRKKNQSIMDFLEKAAEKTNGVDKILELIGEK